MVYNNMNILISVYSIPYGCGQTDLHQTLHAFMLSSHLLCNRLWCYSTFNHIYSCQNRKKHVGDVAENYFVPQQLPQLLC